MRKLKPLEVITLTALLSVGAAADADDYEELPINTLGTVYGVQYGIPVDDYFFRMYDLDYRPTGGYGGVVTNPTKPDAARQAKAKNCAQQYGPYTLPAIYGNVSYDSRFAWERPSSNTLQWTPNNQPPSATGTWNSVAGQTVTRTNFHQVTIFASGYSSFHALLETLVHEFGHANGHDDSVVEPAAEAAYAAYLLDNGAKCGGLAP